MATKEVTLDVVEVEDTTKEEAPVTEAPAAGKNGSKAKTTKAPAKKKRTENFVLANGVEVTITLSGPQDDLDKVEAYASSKIIHVHEKTAGRLTFQDAEDIRDLLANNIGINELTQRFHVSRESVKAVRDGEIHNPKNN